MTAPKEIAMRDEADEWHLAKQIAAGILIAAAVLGGVYYWIQVEKARRVNAGLAELTKTFQTIEAEHRAQMAAAKAAREAKNRQKAATENAHLVEAGRRTQAAADRARQEAGEAAAKEEAWEQFYRPSTKCVSPTDWDTQVECGNLHIRAQREFEVRWQRGDFRNPR